MDVDCEQGRVMIKYLYTEGVEPCSNEPLPVSLYGDGFTSGYIHKTDSGYQYQSKQGNSEIFPTIGEVQRSLTSFLA